ncbi:unnamed protein product [Prunus armeniaca]
MNLYLRMRGRAKESDSESVRLGARLKRGTAIASPEKLFEFVNCEWNGKEKNQSIGAKFGGFSGVRKIVPPKKIIIKSA